MEVDPNPSTSQASQPTQTPPPGTTAVAPYEIWGLLDGRQHPFRVILDPDQTIFDLRDVLFRDYIENYSVGPFRRAHRDDINFTKINVNIYANIQQIGSGMFRPSADLDATPLLTALKISDVWPTAPPQGVLSVFVSCTQNAIGKRPAGDDLEIVRKSKLLKSSPSDMGKPSAYKSLQKQSSQRIWDDRPEADTIPPLSLLYRGFGHFMDHSGLEPHSTICVDSKRRDLERNIDHFATEMSKFYENEAERMVKGLDMINAILGRTLMAASVGSRQFHTDGHYLGPHNAATCVVEFKNEVAEISSIAMVELTAYIGQLHKQSLERHGDSLMGWNLPCLGMTIIGPYITFYGVIFLGQWRTVSLTPTLSCMASGSEGKDREALYAAFSGALDLLRCIDGDAQQFKEAHPTFPHEDRKFPYISELPRFPATSENKKVQFRILKRHPDIQDYRHLYIAKTSDEKDIIVKFTRRYSIELHAFCAESGHAPGLLGFGTIPGGWFGIAMDYISTAVNPSHSHLLNDLRTKWTEDLQQLVKSFHNKNLVHGDLRVPNMICKEEQIMLVDFDWGGRVGEASYPTANLNPELTIGRGNTDRGITMDDDNRILTNTLNNL